MRFRTEEERLRYAEKLARQRLEQFSKEFREECGDAQILSDLEHEILMSLPLSDELRQRR